MRYIKIRWKHSFDNDPVIIYSEIDDNDWEVRKVEVFKDGNLGFSDGVTEKSGTYLGQVPVPPMDIIAESSEFEPNIISKEDFEKKWVEATR